MVDEERMMPVGDVTAPVSAASFLQCFDTVSNWSNKKGTVPLIPKSFLLKHVNEGE